jgi:transcriptional regulator with XRE-family HTH domain
MAPASSPTRTRLGVALRDRRGARSLRVVAAEVSLSRATLGRIESGAVVPSADNLQACAKWLGWTMEQALEASKESSG